MFRRMRLQRFVRCSRNCFNFFWTKSTLRVVPRSCHARRLMQTTSITHDLRKAVQAHSEEDSKIVLRHSTIEKVEEIMQHKFHDRSLLARAMAHRSVVNKERKRLNAKYERKDGTLVNIGDNMERLECVGDRVLGLLTAKALYDEGEYSEGLLSEKLHGLVSRDSNGKYCRMLGLDTLLLESKHLQGKKGYRYGDMFEALLGALFIDGGFDAAQSFFNSRVIPIWKKTNKLSGIRCPKMKLQEYLVRQGLPGVTMGVQLKYIRIYSDKHGQRFTQGLQLFGKTLSVGRGNSRQAAEKAAAEKLLNILQRTKATCLMIRLAREANDKYCLPMLQAVRAVQAKEDESEQVCSGTVGRAIPSGV